MKVVYACGNNDISLECFRILHKEITPVLIIFGKDGDITKQIITESGLVRDQYIVGRTEYKQTILQKLIEEKPDLIISIHFPYIFSAELIKIPRIGIINLHPSYLPYNKGCNTHSWAILDHTLAGATLHWIDVGIDTGDIIDQKGITVQPDDTAHTIYKKVSVIERELFETNITNILTNNTPRHVQNTASGSFHLRKDIEHVKDVTEYQNVIDKLRAFTTNSIYDGCTMIVDGTKYYIRVDIVAENK